MIEKLWYSDENQPSVKTMDRLENFIPFVTRRREREEEERRRAGWRDIEELANAWMELLWAMLSFSKLLSLSFSPW